VQHRGLLAQKPEIRVELAPVMPMLVVCEEEILPGRERFRVVAQTGRRFTFTAGACLSTWFTAPLSNVRNSADPLLLNSSAKQYIGGIMSEHLSSAALSEYPQRLFCRTARLGQPCPFADPVKSRDHRLVWTGRPFSFDNCNPHSFSRELGGVQ